MSVSSNYIVNHLEEKLWTFIKRNRVLGENVIILVSKSCNQKYYEEALYLMCRAGFNVMTVFFEDIIRVGYNGSLRGACLFLSTRYSGKVLAMQGKEGRWNFLSIESGVVKKYDYNTNNYKSWCSL